MDQQQVQLMLEECMEKKAEAGVCRDPDTGGPLTLNECAREKAAEYPQQTEKMQQALMLAMSQMGSMPGMMGGAGAERAPPPGDVQSSSQGMGSMQGSTGYMAGGMSSMPPGMGSSMQGGLGWTEGGTGSMPYGMQEGSASGYGGDSGYGGASGFGGSSGMGGAVMGRSEQRGPLPLLRPRRFGKALLAVLVFATTTFALGSVVALRRLWHHGHTWHHDHMLLGDTSESDA